MNKQKHHHHSTKERQAAFDYLKEGKTIKETASLCGVSPSTIKDWNRTALLRGGDYKKKKKKAPYRHYPHELKCYAVSLYLKGTDATDVALLLGILNPTSVTVWARDERFRGGVALNDEMRPDKNYEKRRSKKPIEDMTPEEELEFLRMENAILKKLISLREERQQGKKK